VSVPPNTTPAVFIEYMHGEHSPAVKLAGPF
jgi:hypothetical protein